MVSSVVKAVNERAGMRKMKDEGEGDGSLDEIPGSFAVTAVSLQGYFERFMKKLAYPR